ncbi:MAG: PEP-CTERM sorting domain-containing protein [Desulfobacteraceae bacterium]|nr:PEP-CTERM sorting domain-containing protein [Desulfobacteraceae bacterium]
MNRILTILTSFLLVFAFAGTAAAVSYDYTDTFKPSTEYMNSWWCWGEGNNSVSWPFDITKEGFDPDTQDIGAATVGLTLEDDNGGDWFFEFAGFNVGQDFWWGEVDTGDYSFRLSVTSLAELSDTGTIDATLTSFWGDFNFVESTLNASTQPVPEPATMLLFGSGLVCLAGIARRRKSAKIRA